MELGQDLIGVLLVVAVSASVIAIALAITALRGQRHTKQAYQAFSRGSDEDVLTLLERHLSEVEALRTDVARLSGSVETLREDQRSALSRIGTLRYDAFEDMGGRLSFSTALLDEHGDGVVLSAINGRSETRTYAKEVTGGSSRHNLSDEEHEAIRRALHRTDRTAGDAGGGKAARGFRNRAASR